MKLGIALFKMLPYRFRGKNRIVPKVKLLDFNKLRNDFEREEENMLILRHPYLTVEQSHGHMKEFKEANNLKMQKQWLEERNEKFTKRVTIEERLNHLRHKEAWD